MVVRPVVVDIETIGVEVADDDTVAVRVPIFCSPSSQALEIEVYFPLKAGLYPLFPVFYLGATINKLLMIPPLRASKKSYLCLYSHATLLLRYRILW